MTQRDWQNDVLRDLLRQTQAQLGGEGAEAVAQGAVTPAETVDSTVLAPDPDRAPLPRRRPNTAPSPDAGPGPSPSPPLEADEDPEPTPAPRRTPSLASRLAEGRAARAAAPTTTDVADADTDTDSGISGGASMDVSGIDEPTLLTKTPTVRMAPPSVRTPAVETDADVADAAPTPDPVAAWAQDPVPAPESAAAPEPGATLPPEPTVTLALDVTNAPAPAVTPAPEASALTPTQDAPAPVSTPAPTPPPYTPPVDAPPPPHQPPAPTLTGLPAPYLPAAPGATPPAGLPAPYAPAPAPAPAPVPARMRNAPLPAFTPESVPTVDPRLAGSVGRAQHGDTMARRTGRSLRRLAASVNLDGSDETRLAREIQQPVANGRVVAVTSIRGGVGKTTVAALLARTLNHYRHDPVLALEADAALGTLPVRLGAESVRWSCPDLAQILTPKMQITDVTGYLVPVTDGGWLLPASQGRVGAPLDIRTYRTVSLALRRYFAMTVVDCETLPGEVARTAMDTAHARVVVAPMTVEGVGGTRVVLDWLAQLPKAALASTVVVLTSSAPDMTLDLKAATAHMRETGVAVVHLPYDRHLAAGGPIRSELLAEATGRAATLLGAEAVQRAARQP
ncbi:hypothetical protein [Streptomyces sp. NPDC046821]|uniref:hypothetical protein n=1 Tax=Streptomyces sp. NPDC046821 TaxID=3154702 RepID=UPI0033C88B1D